jgi:hypothetical protein
MPDIPSDNAILEHLQAKGVREPHDNLLGIFIGNRKTAGQCFIAVTQFCQQTEIPVDDKKKDALAMQAQDIAAAFPSFIVLKDAKGAIYGFLHPYNTQDAKAALTGGHVLLQAVFNGMPKGITLSKPEKEHLTHGYPVRCEPWHFAQQMRIYRGYAGWDICRNPPLPPAAQPLPPSGIPGFRGMPSIPIC